MFSLVESELKHIWHALKIKIHEKEENKNKEQILKN